MPDFRCREMVMADRSSWLEMRARMWDSESRQRHEIDIDKMLSGSRRSGYLVETTDGSRAGFAEICIRDYANGCTEQPVPFLEGIWIEPMFRRRGAGISLLRYIETDLRAQGYRELCSDANLENDVSHAAHATWGFEETDRVVYFRMQL